MSYWTFLPPICMNSCVGMLYPFVLDCKQLLDKERWEESSGQKQQYQISRGEHVLETWHMVYNVPNLFVISLEKTFYKPR